MPRPSEAGAESAGVAGWSWKFGADSKLRPRPSSDYGCVSRRCVS